ncbi:MAG: hypothetical protein HYS12_05380 [Planctomycetes bacterium]|nr:hypothetical protein [Planctomycetota bacterium]
MRDDTARSGAERPGRSKDRKRRGSWEEQPRREGIRRGGGGGEALGERLGPLRRFLLSRAGRPWDKVFSEVCARLRRHPGGPARLRDKIDRIVAMHVVLIDQMAARPHRGKLGETGRHPGKVPVKGCR